jgi:FKBP-type peptidyl-prolyl cis-trans isomerase FkpA
MNPALRFLAPLAVAGMVLTLGACAPEKHEGDAPAAADGAAAAPAAGDGVVTGIEGLTTERDQVSYMIGMDMGKSLDPIKDDIDLELLAQGMADAFAGKAKLTDEQAVQIQQAFTAKLQERQAAERTALAEKNATEGPAFLATNKDKPGIHVTESGLQYQIERAGNGPRPAATDTVRVNYAGFTLDGKSFDASEKHGGPMEIPLNGVIPGWTEGLQLMPVGSKYTFWIPAELAYGENGAGTDVPPNAVLRFEVELIEIVK